jgi:hypothetical protein
MKLSKQRLSLFRATVPRIIIGLLLLMLDGHSVSSYSSEGLPRRKSIRQCTSSTSSRYFTFEGILPALQSVRNEAAARAINSTFAHVHTVINNNDNQYGAPTPVTYTNNPLTVSRWLQDNIPTDGATIGLDVEVRYGSVMFSLPLRAMMTYNQLQLKGLVSRFLCNQSCLVSLAQA